MSEKVRNDLLYELATFAGWGALLTKMVYYIQIGAWPWIWHYSALWVAMLPSITAMIVQSSTWRYVLFDDESMLTPERSSQLTRFARHVEIAEYSEMWVSFVLNILAKENWFTNEKNVTIDFQNLMVWENVISFWLKTVSLIVI